MGGDTLAYQLGKAAGDIAITAYGVYTLITSITTIIASSAGGAILAPATGGASIGVAIAIDSAAVAAAAGSIALIAKGVGQLGNDVGKIGSKQVNGNEGTSSTAKWGMWDDVTKSTYNGREYANINGRYYTREAIDRITPKGYGTAVGGYQARGILTSVVEDVIANGTSREVVRNGVTRTIFESNGVRVVTEEAGKIVITTMQY